MRAGQRVQVPPIHLVLASLPHIGAITWGNTLALMNPSGCPLLLKKNTGTLERTAIQKTTAIARKNHLPKAFSNWVQMRHFFLCKWSEWSCENSRSVAWPCPCYCCSTPGPLSISALPSLLEYRLQRGSFILSFASYTIYSLAPTQHIVETKEVLVEWAIRMLLVLLGTLWVKLPTTPENQVPSPMCWRVSGKALCEYRTQEGTSTLLPPSFQIRARGRRHD